MTCQRCLERRQAIRDAWLKRNIAEAVKQAAIGVGEMVKGVDPAVAEKFHSGGTYTGKPYHVGENGPEFIVPKKKDGKNG